jgi:hypothetical protein
MTTHATHTEKVIAKKDEPSYTPEETAELAYLRFCRAVNNENQYGHPMLAWNELKDNLRAAWVAVVHDVTIHTNAVHGRTLTQNVATDEPEEEEHKKAKAHSGR